KATLALGDANLQEDVYTPLIARVARAPATLDELIGAVSLSALSMQKPLQALTVLSTTGDAAPCVAPEQQEASRAAAESFNACVLERALYGDELQALASPVTGSGVNIDGVNRLFMLARRRGHADPAAFAFSALAARGHRILKDG